MYRESSWGVSTSGKTPGSAACGVAGRVEETGPSRRCVSFPARLPICTERSERFSVASPRSTPECHVSPGGSRPSVVQEVGDNRGEYVTCRPAPAPSRPGAPCLPLALGLMKEGPRTCRMLIALSPPSPAQIFVPEQGRSARLGQGAQSTGRLRGTHQTPGRHVPIEDARRNGTIPSRLCPGSRHKLF